MAKLFNLARMNTLTTGTGTITLGSAITGFLTFAQAGVANTDIVSYGIKDGANSEVGTGTYTSAGTTLTRTVTKSTNADAAISLSGSAEVYVTARKEDMFVPPTNDGIALGLSGTAFSDLFLASGGVINWDAGNVTLTHSTNALSLSSNFLSAGYFRAGSTTVPTNTALGDITGGRISIGNQDLTGILMRINGAVNNTVCFFGLIEPAFLSGVTSAGICFAVTPATEAAAFTIPTLTYFFAQQSVFGAGSAVTTQVAFYADASITGAGTNMGFRGQIAAAAGRYNLYMDGTARNYLEGSLSVGVDADPGAGLIYTDSASFILRSNTSLTGGGTGNVPTLTSGPVTGNPTKWLPYDDAGVTRYIPSW